MVGRVAAGQLEQQPGVDRAEDRPLGPLDVAQQPLDLGRGEVGVDDEAGALAHQLLVTGRAQLRRSARRCGGPARPAPGGSARRVAGSQATTVSRWLVIPIASSSAPWMPASTIASTATRRLTSQISAASCSTQPGPREVLLELRVGPAGDPSLPVEDQAGGPRRPLVDRQDQGRAPRTIVSRPVGDAGGVLSPVPSRRRPIPYISATIVRAWRPGSGTSSVSSAAAATPS